MTWTLPSSKAGLAVLISLVMVVSASVGFVTLGLLDNGNEPSPDENATDTGETAPDDALQAACANTSATASLRQGAPGQRAQLNNTSSAAAPSTSGTAPMQVRRENATQAAKRGDGTMRTNIKCAIANLSSPPAWVSNLTNATGTSEQATATPGETRATNTTRAVESQRAFARDLRALLSNESRSRRAATLDAAERALGERQQLAADGQLNASLQPLLTAERTNLRGARRLLQTETQTKTEGPNLRRAARLATQGMKLQTARLNQDSGSADPTAVSLPDTPMPDHDRPSAAAFAILEQQNVQPTDDQAADIRALDDLPESTRTELTDYLDAYLGYYLTTQQAYAGANRTRLDNTSASGSTASPSAADLQRVRAAHQRLLDATVTLQTALDDPKTSGSGAGSSRAAVNETVQVAPVLSIDLSSRSNTYETEYALQIDRGGDDTYNNNAGGNTGNFSAAALADFGGSDTYRGRNGGGVWDGAGFLVDAGPGTDTYNATDNPDRTPLAHFCIDSGRNEIAPGSYGTNGGGALGGVGFLLDAGNGKTTYTAGNHGTNGGARGEFCTSPNSETQRKLALGFLVDAGTSADTYLAGHTGTNGGGSEGYGFLMDTGGDDTYDAGKSATNGGGIGATVKPLEGPIGNNLRDITQISKPYNSYPHVPAPGGFLLDTGGTDTYTARANSNDVTYGTNGGGASGGTGFLMDVGTSSDTYVAGNGTAKWGTNGGGFGGVGFLLDEAGSETYDAGDTGTNGGSSGGAGFLLDGAGTDTYDAGGKGTNGGAVKTRVLLATVSLNDGLNSYFSDDTSVGILLDAGTGNDSYTAGHWGTNGGADGGTEPIEREDTSNEETVEVNKVPAGFLFDAGGSDSYVAGFENTNGGASNGVGVLYDNTGADFYNDATVTCHDCSQIPKGSVGAQVDRGGDGESGEGSDGGEVLVVDDNAGAADADCPDASYQAIQPAVDNASSGATVRVCPGTYPGLVTVDTPGVTLQAADTGQVLLDGGWTRQYGVALQARGTTVAGFTAANFSADHAAAFLSTMPSTTIANNTVQNSYYGVLYAPPDFDDPPETAIRDNTITSTPIGIKIMNAEVVTIHDNTVTGHTVRRTRNQRGISSVGSKTIRITDNTVTGFMAAPNRTFSHTAPAPFGYGYGIEILNSNPGADAEYTLRNNRMANNTYNLQLYSLDPEVYSDYDIDASNTVNGKPVVYMKGVRNSVIDRAVDPGYLACIDCVNVTVRNMEFAHNGQGVLVANSRNVSVRNVTVHDTWQGIAVQGSPDQTAVTNNTVWKSYTAIDIRHECDRLTACVPNGPSVMVEHNTVRQTGFLFNTPSGGQQYIGVDSWHGGAILVTGNGVTVHRNTITDAYGAGISVKNKEPYSDNNGDLLGTGLSVELPSNVESAVANNSISDSYFGIMSIGNDGTSFTGNEISDTRIGLFNVWNRDLLYRDNTVTNATVGMFVHFADVNITARQNSFQEVRWGIDVLYTWFATPPNAPASHNFGTSNTVNGEQVLWIEGATNRVIDDADANYVVCVRCTNVTIRDMTLTDNAHGVVLWDATNSSIVNVTVTDTLHQGVTIVEGQNNVVRDSTIIDSHDGIRVQPKNRDNNADSLETVGAVRLIDNYVTVKNASYPAPPYSHSGFMMGWTEPLTWAHTGIYLINPTTVTVDGNHVTNMSWGIKQRIMVLAERHPREYQYPKAADNVQILNNTVTHPAEPMGLARQRRGDRFHIVSDTMGIRVHTKKTKLADARLVVNNNTLTDYGSITGNPDQSVGIRIDTDDIPRIAVEGNRIRSYGQSVRIASTADTDTLGVSIRRNRLRGASQASIFLAESTPGDAVGIHGNLLQPQASADSAGHGVMYANRTRTVNATCNKWGAPSGPSSHGGATLADPETGESADGAGSAVSASATEGEANVRFHPWLGESPQLVCNLRAEIPAEKPTQTPRPTVDGGDGPGSGDGDGPGSGDGDGPGNGDGDGGGRNEDGDQNRPTASEGTPEARGKTSETPSETPTEPPLATPEIVPGFGVGTGLVAFAILLGLLVVRRRE